MIEYISITCDEQFSFIKYYEHLGVGSYMCLRSGNPIL